MSPRQLPEEAILSNVLLVSTTWMILTSLTGCRANNLTCVSCNTTNKDDICSTNGSLVNTIIYCKQGENFCYARRIETYGVFTSFTRGCIRRCQDGCGVWGEDIDRDNCTSCCTEPNCNTGSGASSLTYTVSIIHLVSACWLLLVMLSTYRFLVK